MSDMKPIAACHDPLAKRTIARFEELRSERSRHEQDWQDIALLFRPQRGGFGLSDPAQRDLQKPLSSEPIVASQSMAAGLYSAMTNPSNRWAGFETPDQDFNRWQPMAEWIDICTRRVFASFSPSMSSFYSATIQTYNDIAAFGNGPAYDEFDEVERRFVDVAFSLAEVVCTIDAWGRVTEIIRRTQLTPISALMAFKRGGTLPEKIHDLANKYATEKHAYYSHIALNEMFEPGRIGTRGKRWRSVTVCEVDECLVRDKGYDEMPAYWPRWDVDSGQAYGTGPGFIALPAARVLQLSEAADIRARQMASDPTMLAPDKDTWALSGKIRPGSVVYGGVNHRGEQMIHPLHTGALNGMTLQEKNAKKEEIAKAFHYAVLPLTGRTGLSPEEARIIEEANLRNWAPNADRIMEEYARAKVERRFRLLWRLGQLPPAPQEAKDLPLQVRYQSAATMAQMAREAQATRTFLEDLAVLSNLGHSERVTARIDPDAVMETLHENSPSVPARILVDRAQADKASQVAAQGNQAMQMMQMAQGGAGALKDTALAAKAGAEAGLELPDMSEVIQ